MHRLHKTLSNVQLCRTVSTLDKQSRAQSSSEKSLPKLSLADFMPKPDGSSVDIPTTSTPISTPFNVPEDDDVGNDLTYMIETYGCQMNVSDSEIVRSVLDDAGHSKTTKLEEAELIMLNTCAIRENAEAKIWRRLQYLQSVRRDRKLKNKKAGGGLKQGPYVGVLGCMAERLKTRLLEEESVDFVVGPDAYRDIPRLVHQVTTTSQKEANTLLSLEETYADIRPVRDTDSSSAFVSIMRGCNNMCSYCIVPFTRGRERSRDMKSILNEVQHLVNQDVKEICLLGQNVNGYHDISTESALLYPTSEYKAAEGFNNIYRSKQRNAPGARFVDLLTTLSDISPELRIRFTSPHPKDFPDEVFYEIAARPNLTKSLHLPAQSGSTSVLQRMRRGYSREAYLDLVQRAREIIPDVGISTDMISGFCGETEEEHQDTLSLMKEVQFDQAFLFAYSLRERTHAAHNLEDDVPEEIKLRRLQEVIDVYRTGLQKKNTLQESHQIRLVLVEGPSTKSSVVTPLLTGRTDNNKRVIFPANAPLFDDHKSDVAKAAIQDLIAYGKGVILKEGEHMKNGVCMQASADLLTQLYNSHLTCGKEVYDRKETSIEGVQNLQVGQYAVVLVQEAFGPTLRGVAVAASAMESFHQ